MNAVMMGVVALVGHAWARRPSVARVDFAKGRASPSAMAVSAETIVAGELAVPALMKHHSAMRTEFVRIFVYRSVTTVNAVIMAAVGRVVTAMPASRAIPPPGSVSRIVPPIAWGVSVVLMVVVAPAVSAMKEEPAMKGGGNVLRVAP